MAKKSDLTRAKELVLKYADFINSKVKIKKLYMFGSYVKKTQDGDSDIDIAVISNDLTGDSIDDMAMLMKLGLNIDSRIEPHPFLPKEFNKGNPFAREIMQTGIRLI